MRVEFEIPGRPVAKQRPRTVRGNTYTPPKTRAYEEAVGMLARNTRAHFDEPVRVEIALTPLNAHVTVVSYGSSSKLRGDIDNYAKSILDGIVKGGLIRDDIDIVSLLVTKEE